jgi:hypothetical protein
LAELLSFGKNPISFELNFNLFLEKELSLGKTYISSWLHFYLLAKFIFPFAILIPFSCYKIFYSNFFSKS